MGTATGILNQQKPMFNDSMTNDTDSFFFIFSSGSLCGLLVHLLHREIKGKGK